MKGDKADTGIQDPEVPGQQTDVFDSTFDAAAGEKPPEGKVEVVDPPPPVEKKEPVSQPNAEIKSAEIEKPVEEINDEEKTYEQRWKSLQGIYKSSKTAWDKEKAELLAQVKREPEPTPVIKEKEKPKETKPDTFANFLDSLTPEQKAELEDYERDFDIISKMEGLKREKAFSAMEARLKSFTEELISKIDPLSNFMKQYQVEKEIRSSDEHFGSIAGAHPDYEEYRDNGAILTWIDSKPKYMQKGLKDIYQNGEAEDVIELLDDFKKENNLMPDVNAQVVDLNGKREQKRQALKSVPSRRAAVNPAMSVKEDYEGAFDEATNK